MAMKKVVCAIVGLLLVALAIAGCGSSKSKEGTKSSQIGSSKTYAELRWGMTPFPGALDYAKVGYGATGATESLAVQSLMEYEPDGKIKLGLASSAEQPSPTTYVYHLKSVKFSDGTPLTAADAVFSLDRAVYGKESFTKSFYSDVASVSARGSATVVVKLKRPSVIFPDVVAAYGQIIEKAAAEKTSEKELGTPGHMVVGTGPWKIDSYTPESNTRFSRNPYWTGPKQPAERISIEYFKTEAPMALALRSGTLDGADVYFSPRTFANIPGVRQLVAQAPLVVMAEVNTKLAPFNDLHVRRAMAYATNSKGMIDALFHGLPGAEYAIEDKSVVPEGLFVNLGSHSEIAQTIADLPKYGFNLAKAKEELAKSAYPHGFSTTIEIAQESAQEISDAQILAADLAKIGIKASVHEATHAEETAWLTGKNRFSFTEAGASFPDPIGLIEQRLGPGQIYPEGGGINDSNYRNSEFDKLLEESDEALNAHQRLQMIGKMLKIAGGEAPVWPLYSPGLFASLSEKYVMSFSFWTAVSGPWALSVKPAS
jgi:peptide/nickel transport system substrate-binding protein